MASTRQSDKLGSPRFARLDLDPALRERKTTSEHVAEALRAAIYDGQFEDWEELNQVELAEHFQVSRVPVREALSRLQAEGLVSHVAHRRAVVIGLGLDEIIELIEMRAVLEAYLVEKSAPKLAGADIQKLRALCAGVDTERQYDLEWVRKNWEFHRALYSRSNSPSAIEFVERIHLKVERYVRRAGRRERLLEAAREHREIVEQIVQGNIEEAGAQIKRHILHTGDEIRRWTLNRVTPA